VADVVEGQYPLLAWNQANPDGGIFASVVAYPNLLPNGMLDPTPGADVEDGTLTLNSASETLVSGSFSGTLVNYDSSGSGSSAGPISGSFSAPVCR
jgi:hypothetical protein